MTWWTLLAALVGLPATAFVTGAIVEGVGQVFEWAESRWDPSRARSVNPIGEVLACGLRFAGLGLGLALLLCVLALIWWPLLAAVRWVES